MTNMNIYIVPYIIFQPWYVIGLDSFCSRATSKGVVLNMLVRGKNAGVARIGTY